MVPSAFASSLVADGNISRLNLETKFTLRPLGVAYRSNGDIPPVALAFMKVLREWAKTNARALAGDADGLKSIIRRVK